MQIARKEPVIEQIDSIVQDIPGWSPIDQLYTLFNLAQMSSHLAGDIIEVGTWCGRSAVVLAMAAKLFGNSLVHCVDLFPGKNDWKENDDGSFSLDVTIKGKRYHGYQEQTVWREPFLRDIAPLYEKNESVFDIFSEVIVRKGVTDIIRSHRGDLESFVNTIPADFQCRVAFIDGDHSYEATSKDIELIEPHLVSGGWICFDDAFSHYQGVNQAICDHIIANDAFDICQQMTRKFFVARKR